MTAKKHYFSITVAVIFLLNPNFNMIDILPDFVAYLLLAKALSGAAEAIPYMYETKSALTNLVFVSVAKLPAMLIMYSNMYTGRDIIPLFTLIFSAIELYLLTKVVLNGSSALYYLGERSEARSLITPTRALGKNISAEGVRNLTLAFLAVKAVLNVIPQFCLLTFTSNSYGLQRLLNTLFPILEISGMSLCLVFGIIWLLVIRAYLSSIKKEGRIGEALLAVAGVERAEAINTKSRGKVINRTLLFLCLTSLFSFEIVLTNTDNINILPHFIYGIMLMVVGWKLFHPTYRILMCSAGGLYVMLGCAAHITSVSFHNGYDYIDLLDNRGAVSLYVLLDAFAVAECIFFLAFTAVLILGYNRFIRENTGISPESERYGDTSRALHRRLTIKGGVMFLLAALVNIGKCLNTIFNGIVQRLFTENGTMFTEPLLPWFGTAVFVLTAIYVAFSLYHISEIRDEVKMKYNIGN